MKVCHFLVKQDPFSKGRLGLLSEAKGIVVDCNSVWALEFEREGRYNPRERADHRMPSSLHAVLNIKEDPIEALSECWGLFLFFEKIGQRETREGISISFPIKDVTLLNPLDKITSYRDFYTHEKHVATSFKKRGESLPDAWYEIPAYYKGATQGFIGPETEILWPHYTNKLDYELELALIIGREGRNIRPFQVHQHIFGFTILNDISARDIQRKEMSIRLGPAKGKDFCSVLGPVITTIDEFDNIDPNLHMTAKINGETWSQGQSGDAHYSWSQILQHLSMDEWILPGDVLASGTVGTGCGMELDRWIQEGDLVELEVEGIGKLINRVGRKHHGKF